ncbi:ubiquitin fusion degradation protein 1 [Hyaloraphidium curvatum]|nr:ubiquitin fusion degradation protein 1 [Hyaloraphidium curvatum]
MSGFQNFYDAGGFHGGFPGMMPAREGAFDEMLRAYSVVMMATKEPKENVNYGGKILLPPSALDKLSRLHIEYPMTFELSNRSLDRKTHAGVLEFVAEEGRVYLPNWMMSQLLLEQGDLVRIRNTSLPTGYFVKIQPQHPDFLQITDPRAVLENVFRNFSTLTQGDIISISYNKKTYDILVMEIKPPGKGISILETDLEVDFAPPLGYVEPEAKRPASATPSLAGSQMSIDQHVVEREKPSFSAFAGSGNRLSNKGKGAAVPPSEPVVHAPSQASAAPAALHLPPGKLFFGYKVEPYKTKEEKEAEKEAAAQAAALPTTGGQTLRGKKPPPSPAPSPKPPAPPSQAQPSKGYTLK